MTPIPLGMMNSLLQPPPKPRLPPANQEPVLQAGISKGCVLTPNSISFPWCHIGSQSSSK